MTEVHVIHLAEHLTSRYPELLQNGGYAIRNIRQPEVNACTDAG